MFIYNVLNTLLTVYVYIVIIRALVSWFSPDPYNPLYRILIDLTEPILSRIRKIMPNLGGIDLSPIILILIIEWLIRGILLRILFTGIRF